MSRPQVAILSADDRFARLLQLELEAWQLTVRTGQTADRSGAEVAIVDLDSAEVPPEETYGYLIGFSRLPALSADADARRCAMILRRPFRMSLLRREVLAHLFARSAESAGEPECAAREVLSLTDWGLACGGVTVPLTPTERRIVALLLEAGGEAVPKVTLDAVTDNPSDGKTAVYICGIRKKLREAGIGTTVETVRGVGYCLSCAEKSRKNT